MFASKWGSFFSEVITYPSYPTQSWRQPQRQRHGLVLQQDFVHLVASAVDNLKDIWRSSSSADYKSWRPQRPSPIGTVLGSETESRPIDLTTLL